MVLATVIASERSAQRGPGAALAVSVDGDLIDSLSGGCIKRRRRKRGRSRPWQSRSRRPLIMPPGRSC
ncbi:MAG: hypothetical protein DLM67_05250 [Candidatus Nephthysia bennettiae]|nr:MAG: hypothetical protein DLM67_05250 [Candidatus Dormibacteraeota bacterium]